MKCIGCRRALGALEVTYPTDDGELCEGCDADYPPQLRPSLGYVPALLQAVARGDCESELKG